MPTRFSHSTDDRHDWHTLACANCGRLVSVPVRCGLRFCNICNGARRSRTFKRLRFICANTPTKHSFHWKSIELTLVSQYNLSDMVDHIICAFRKLRARRFWRSATAGGIYVIELTHSQNGWHVHLHILVYAKWIPQDLLSAEWKRITGAPVVWIQRISARERLPYVIKYICKLSVPEELGPHVERALAQRRLWSPFGEAHDLNLTYKPEPHHCERCNGCDWIMIDFARWTAWNPDRAP
jgi:hypothetical protein